jgi:hypothetical protein
VYDVDARGRRAPGWPGGNVSRLAVDETLEVRQYLNEGGKLLYTGQWAGGTENGVGGTNSTTRWPTSSAWAARRRSRRGA